MTTQCGCKKRILDRGIDDMKAGRELPVNDAFKLVAELVEKSIKY